MILDNNGDKERKINPRSLENLKLGAQARNQDKQRTNLTLLPETVRWLKGWGNASDKVDEMVAEARRHPLGNQQPQPTSNQNQQELDELRAKVKDLQQALQEETKRADDAEHRGLKAADILHEALKLKPNAGGAIKAKIKEALPFIDDV